MPGLPASVYAAAEPGGFVTRERLLARGWRGPQIDWWLATGLLEWWSRSHYRIAEAGADDMGRLLAALERAGEGARIGGAWACALHGLEGFDLSGRDHVVIDPRRRVRGAPFTVVRTPVPPCDQAVVGDVPTLTVTRSLMSVAPTHPRKAVRVAYYQAVCAGHASMGEMSERATALGRAYGAPETRALVASGDLRYESEGERALAQTWRPGDPPLHPQVWVVYRSRFYRLDFALLDARMCLEYDGAEHHSGELDRLRDTDRDLALAELDIQTLRITARMLRTPERTRERILAVWRQRVRLGLPAIVPAPPPRRAA